MSISVAFEKARAEGRAVLVGCMPAGFPTVEGSIAAMTEMVAAGVDVIEVELPYSDPVMDGPVIQRASDIALAGGVRTADTLRIIETVAATGAPVALMTYWNPIERYGVDAFARDLAAAGGTGLITPDLIPDEAAEWLAASDTYGLDRTFLVSPSSTDARIEMTVAHCRGFVYATALMGVTGAREQTSSAAPTLVTRVRAASAALRDRAALSAGAPERLARSSGQTPASAPSGPESLPVGVGLGVGNGAQAAEVGSYADGVIVGSALIRCLLDADSLASGLTALRALSTELADGVRAVGGLPAQR